MRLIEFYQKIKAIGLPFFKTRDVAVICKISNSHASQLLTRLTKTEQVVQLKKGLWVIPEKIESMALPYLLTIPEPSYISLQSALHYHGMITQISEITYAVSVARTRVFTSSLGTVSIHHISADMFFGYDEIAPYVFMATPEKALIDFLYFNQAKSRLFSHLPEVEIPNNFDKKVALNIIKKIPYLKRQESVYRLFTKFITSG